MRRLAAFVTVTVALTAGAIVHPTASFAVGPAFSGVTMQRVCPPASPPGSYQANQDYFSPPGFVDNANGVQLHLMFEIDGMTLGSANFTPNSDHFALGPAEKIGTSSEIPLGHTPVVVTLNLQDSSNTTVATASVPVNGCPSGLHTDFDGNGRDDLVVFRPSNGDWYANDLTTSPYSSTVHNVRTHFGTAGDVPVAADYNGDGLTDYAVFRPSTGNWYFSTGPTVHFGTAGDIPVPGFYVDDNTLSLAVFRPSTGNWFIRGRQPVHWGTPGDIPAPADLNTDGKEDVVVYRPSNGMWYDRDDSRFTTQWGALHDIPVPGNYGAGGDIPSTQLSAATFRPSNGTWYEKDAGIEQFGRNGDVPVPMDHSGHCYSSPIVFRPSSGFWYIDGVGALHWGAQGDVPIRPIAPCPGTLFVLF
ncbi:MAG: FG-GAP repeat domain-containing protein [Actinomycetes bacterium]